MKRTARFLLTYFLLLSGLITLGGCDKNETAAAPAGEMPGVNVVAVKAIEQDLSDQIALVGSLDPNESIEIKSELDGTVETINFVEGQKVEEGDLLFQIDMKKLQATYDQAKANAKLAKTTAERYESLVASRAVSRQEYDQTIATLESANAELVLVEEQMKDATITAPFDGVMGERLVSSGQFIAKGAMLSSLINQDPMKVRFHVPERYLGEIAINQSISMRVAAYPGRTFTGRVYFIDPEISEETRTALVKATVPNPDGSLRVGMFANLELIVAVKDEAVVIPEAALIVRGDTLSVYIVKEDNTVEMKQVVTGKRFDGLVEIKSGCEAGDLVVVEGYQKIGPGSKVNPSIKEKAPKQSYEII